MEKFREFLDTDQPRGLRALRPPGDRAVDSRPQVETLRTRRPRSLTDADAVPSVAVRPLAAPGEGGSAPAQPRPGVRRERGTVPTSTSLEARARRESGSRRDARAAGLAVRRPAGGRAARRHSPSGRLPRADGVQRPPASPTASSTTGRGPAWSSRGARGVRLGHLSGCTPSATSSCCKVVKKLLDAGVSLPNIRTAIGTLRDRGVEELAQITLMSDGTTVYECTSNDEVVDLLQGGQAVFAIAVGRQLRDVEGSLAALPGRAGPGRRPCPNAARRQRRAGRRRRRARAARC